MSPLTRGPRWSPGTLRKELELLNRSAVKSLAEGLAVTLTLNLPQGQSHLGEKPEFDELLGVDYVAHCSAYGQGGPLAHERPEAALGGHGSS